MLGDRAVRAVDAVFVKLACAGVRHRDRPEAAAAVLYQIGLGPAVARAGQRNAAGIGRKGTENDSVLLYVSAKPVVGVENFACEELVLIHGSTSFLFPLTGGWSLAKRKNCGGFAGETKRVDTYGFYPLGTPVFLGDSTAKISELRL